jgi:hypothetical protein
MWRIPVSTAVEKVSNAGGQSGEELLSVTGLVKHFPVRAGVLQRQVAAVQSARARRSRWSGSPAAARRRPGGS